MIGDRRNSNTMATVFWLPNFPITISGWHCRGLIMMKNENGVIPWFKLLTAKLLKDGMKTLEMCFGRMKLCRKTIK